MRCYWFRIGAGALAIFVLGMFVIGFTRRGVDRVQEFASSIDDVVAPADFVPFGAIRLEPAGETRTLFMPAEMVREARAAVQTASMGIPDPKVHIRANEQGAHLDIQGDGEGLFYLRADSNGARVLIRDDSGRIVLNLRADSAGAAMDVNALPSPGK